MDAGPVTVIRETARNVLKLNRQMHKDELTDVRRSIDAIRITPDTVADIANRLKNKNGVSLTELHLLKNILIEDKQNINTVLGIHGSLRGLVRELSGQDVKRQCAAVGCLCNLALGDSKACFAIAKAAGSYLVTALENLSTELAVSCAWALGNLSGAGPRAARTLAAQGAAARLTALLACGDERTDAAVYALIHYTRHMKDELSNEYVQTITEAFTKLELDLQTSQLLSYVSCHQDFTPNQDLVLKILNSTAVSTETHLKACTVPDICCNITYLVRTLANISTTKVNCDFVLNYLNQRQLLECFKRILTGNSYVKESLLWLLGNLFNYCSDNSFMRELVS